MATVIKLKKSETASSVPDTGDLAVGEVAINTADQALYVETLMIILLQLQIKGKL